MMECHDVQQLLAFVNRQREELDAPEREALGEHLEKCPDCAVAFQTERRADEILGALVREVPVPADLRQKLLNRLATEHSQAHWKLLQRASLVAAAAILLVVTAGLSWQFWPKPEITRDYVMQMVSFHDWDKEQVEHFFAEQGLSVKAPGEFDYRFLQHVEIVQFKGKPVAKLTFSRTDDQTALVNVLILSTKQFRMHELEGDQDIPLTTWIRVRHHPEDSEFTYLVFYRGQIDAVLRRIGT